MSTIIGDPRPAGEEGPAGDPRPAGDTAEANDAFDPSSATVAEVQDHLDTTTDDEKQRVLDAEKAGKNRTSITV